jgi:hypothetical protein
MKFPLAFLMLLVTAGSIADEPLRPIPERSLPAVRVADEVTRAKAVITDPNGQPLPEVMPLGEMVVFSFKRSVRGPTAESMKVIIEPPERAARTFYSDDMLTAYVPTGLKPVDISCTLIVAKGDIPDWTRISIKCGEGPIPPPVPPDPPKPDPKPPVPPEPVKTFRVIFVYESSQTLTASQTAVKDSAYVRQYLMDKTTKEGEYNGWRAYDRDTDAAFDNKSMRALWTAVKPKITTVPCIVVEVNGKVEILDWPANVAEALTTLKRYGGQ